MPRPLQHQALLASRPHKHRAPTLVYPAEWWSDDLEWGLGWTKDAQTGTATVERYEWLSHAGTYSLHLATRTATPANNDLVQAGQLCLAPTQDYWTAALWLCQYSWLTVQIADVHLACYNAGHKYTANFAHIHAANKWQYYNAAGALADVPGGAYVWPNDTWVPITLQIRKSTLRWGTVTWPGGSADLSTQGLYDAGANATTGARIEIKLVANAQAPTELYADDLQLFHSPNP